MSAFEQQEDEEEDKKCKRNLGRAVDTIKSFSTGLCHGPLTQLIFPKVTCCQFHQHLCVHFVAKKFQTQNTAL